MFQVHVSEWWAAPRTQVRETEVSSKPLFGTAQGQHRNGGVNG